MSKSFSLINSDSLYLQEPFVMPKLMGTINRVFVDSKLEDCNKTRDDLVKRYREIISGEGDDEIERNGCLDNLLEVGVIN